MKHLKHLNLDWVIEAARLAGHAGTANSAQAELKALLKEAPTMEKLIRVEAERDRLTEQNKALRDARCTG